MEERSWTPRAAAAHAQMLGPAVNVDATATATLEARDPEMMCAALRVGDDGEDPARLRFKYGVLAMDAGAYACAYAARDDGGRCWAAVNDEYRDVPASSYAAAVLRRVCDNILRLSEDLAGHDLADLLNQRLGI
eukprot:scaffold16340_cov25-Prasinocladus_malaysianus.AAC.2